jgi:hydroxypyruvate isomerase
VQRREFLRATAALATPLITHASRVAAAVPARTFRLKYAPHLGMFKASAAGDLFDELRFMAGAGFRAFEDNGMMARAVDIQQRIGDTLSQLGMTMGVFVIDAGDNWKVTLATGKPEFRERFVTACRTAVDVAKRCRAKWMTVVPGYFDREQRIGIQTGHVVDALRAGADVLAPHGLVMVLEPLSDNPDLFLRTSDQAYAICRAVNSPACKILYDIYHMQRNEGHLIPHIDAAWEEIAYFQIGDVPGRKEPGTGETNYQNVFKHIHARMLEAGRDFVFGMEHGNSVAGAEGEQKVIEAYVRADSF